MQKRYIDISNLLAVDFLTGIQRVTRNVILELLKIDKERYVLLCCSSTNEFSLIDNDLFIAFYSDGCSEDKPKKSDMILKTKVKIRDIPPGSVFFDLDSVWNTPMRRSSLLPELKKAGVKCAAYIYDIIPVLMPQFCAERTVYYFLDYIGAEIQYSDYLITSTQTVLDQVNELCDKLSINRKQGGVSWLGSDFSPKQDADLSEVAEDVRNKVEGKKYILCVGTIEPRKNHKFLLDVFENYLFKQGISLVLVGRIGWNVSSLVQRIENSEYLDKQLFHFTGLNDQTLDYLYDHAVALAFPTHGEGFGLPMIEAFEKGLPVIASDIPVLREVGGDFADYFALNDQKSFTAIVDRYLSEPGYADKKRSDLKGYKSVTWAETSEKINALLDNLKPEQIAVPDRVKQIVYLTARVEDIRRSLAYVDNLMPFLEEAVICCPDKVADEMGKLHADNLKIKLITDSQLLNGRELPEDHQVRNTFLRVCAMRLPDIDDVFIMSDDDARPLRRIDMDYYIKDGVYQGYYCYDLDKWKGDYKPTSYDEGMFRTYRFLKEQGYPVRQFSSHMPQIIDKRVYLEMAERFPGIEGKGYDEWSTYFNYLTYHYPEQICLNVYETLAWPGNFTDWDRMYKPEKYSFENFYDFLYEAGGSFEGFSDEYGETTLSENKEKIKIYDAKMSQLDGWKKAYQTYAGIYEAEYDEYPDFRIVENNMDVTFMTPEQLILPRNAFIRIPVSVKKDKLDKISLTYWISNSLTGNLYVQENTIEDLDLSRGEFTIPVWTPGIIGKMLFCIKIISSAGECESEIPLIIINA